MCGNATSPESLLPLYHPADPTTHAGFDEGTRNKIHILSAADLTAALSAHMPASSIPRKYGGTLDWTFGRSGPNLDCESRETLGLEEGEQLPNGPLRWRRQGGGLSVVGGSGRSKEEKNKWNSRGRTSELPKEPVANGHPPGVTASDGAADSAADAVVPLFAHKDVSSSFSTAQESVLPSSTAASIPSVSVQRPTPAAPAEAEAEANGEALPPAILGLGYSNETARFVEPNAQTSGGVEATGAIPAAGQAAAAGAAVRGEGHDIHVAARENAGAPIKDLAAALEGTTL